MCQVVCCVHICVRDLPDIFVTLTGTRLIKQTLQSPDLHKLPEFSTDYLHNDV